MRKPNGYWTEEKVVEEYRVISNKIGYPARTSDIEKFKRKDLLGGIAKNGGICKIRELAGYRDSIKQYGYWTLENTLKEYEKVSEEVGHPATQKELVKLKRGGLLGGIAKNGSLEKIRKLAGYDNPTKPNGYWTEENTVKEYKEISEQLGHPLPQPELKKLKKHGLLSAIWRNGGLIRIRALAFNYPYKKKKEKNPKGYWTLDKVVEDYKGVSNVLGHPATDRNLRELKRGNLLWGIQRNGGIYKIRKLAGYDNIKKPNGYWTEEKVVKDYKVFSDRLGHAALQEELERLERQDLLGAINKHGGILKIRALAFGKPYKSKKEKLENLIGEYILK